MKLGLLSDTHGNLAATAEAARLMIKQEVGAVIHCGDIGGEEVLTELAALLHPLNIPLFAVLGNMDLPATDWRFFPSALGVELKGRFGEIELDNYRIAFLHGDQPRRLHDALQSGLFDLVFTGHTHRPHDRIEGSTRWINPGSAGRGHPNTIGILDLSSGALQIIELS